MCQKCSQIHHNQNHNHKTNKAFFYILAMVILLFICASFLNISLNLKIILYATAYFLVGKDVIKEAFKNIFNGRVFDENFLMTTATVCAFIIGEYPEAVMVMFLYKIGEFLQDKAVAKSKNSITKLIDLRQDSVNVLFNGEIITKNANEVKIGDFIIVKKGEKIPVDGIVIEGSADIDMSILNGESLPKYSTINDSVLSGCILIDGFLKIKTTKEFGDSTASKILKLIEESANKKAATEMFITKFAKKYTPTVVILAILLTVIPVLVFGSNFDLWFKRALTFLVISCPCALVISIPLGFFAGIGKASKNGILIKGSEFIEKLTNIAALVFDKTGTLTKGYFCIEKSVSLCELNNDDILKIAAKIESFSNHPIAKAFSKIYTNLNIDKITNIQEISGNGLKAKIDGESYIVGRKHFIETNNINAPLVPEAQKVIYVAKNNVVIGYVVLGDKLKDNAENTIKKLKKYTDNIVILSGDNKDAVQKTAQKLNIKKYYYNLLPQDKLKELENIIANKKQGKNTIYIGDGINDAPSLKISDVGIAIGAYKTDSAIEASDIVIMNDNLLKIPQAIEISKKTMQIVKQNIIFSIFIKVLFLIMGAIGFVNIQGAVFADVGVTLIAVANSIRILK